VQRRAVNAGAKYSACRQIANGGIYDGDRVSYDVHQAKTEATVEILEELGGKPALIAYQYDHDLARLQHAIKGLHVIRGGMKESEISSLIDRWNSDSLDVPYLAVQPQALSYGINMQKGSGRDIIWYGPTDNLDTYIQFNARIWRQGVTSGVRVHRIRCIDTIDDVVWDRIDQKFDVQANLLEVLAEYARQRA
jgi:SNF2 family DNA or RNA helicase